MAPAKPAKPPASPKVTTKDPSLPSSLPTSSKNKNVERIDIDKAPRPSFRKRCCTYLYNREKKTFCGRTCQSWLSIITYSIMYLLFLCTYTMFFLYGSLWIIRLTTDFKESTEALTYSAFTVGLSATPTSESSQPLIWYRVDHREDYQKYIDAIDNLLIKKRRKRPAKDLGPCGETPYGYGDKPCIILRVNKHLKWSAQPLQLNSTEAEMAPSEVREWMKRDKKLWLHCEGHDSYDKEHVGRIRYFPDPPGFDPSSFPPAVDRETPLAAIQVSGFTLSVSISIECKLWYANGPSSIDFILYASNGRTFNRYTS